MVNGGDLSLKMLVQSKLRKPVLLSVAVHSLRKGELSFLHPSNDSKWAGFRDLSGRKVA